MHADTKHAGWGAALLIVCIVVAMSFCKSRKYAEVEQAAIEMTGSVSR
jgi:hypothetical protein